MNTEFNNILLQKKRQTKIRLVKGSLVVILMIILILSIGLGKAIITPHEVVKVLTGKLLFKPELYDGVKAYKVAIIWDIRLPRIITGLLVGMGLSVAGSIFQALLMNPLADPYTIGVSTGAAFGATVIIYINLFISAVQIPIMPFAFIGALCTLLIVMRIANSSGVINSSNLIIAGIIVSSILSAGISFLKNAAGEQVSVIVFWIMGSLAAKSWTHVIVVTPIVLGGILVAYYFSKDLDILSLGDKDAKSLGIDVNKMRKIFLIIGSLITAACVSVSGVIGFVGLVIPHLIRFSLTTRNKDLIPLAAILGGLILMLADNLSRVMFAAEVPVGVLTTLLGGPFFIYIFMKKSASNR